MPKSSRISCGQRVISKHLPYWVGPFILLCAIIMAAEEPGANKTPVPSAVERSELDRPSATAADPTTPTAMSRLREGSKIADQLGEFQKTADRYSFYLKDGKGVVRVLENLALERVARSLEDDPSPRLWSVSGVLTEYRGENFLLVTRAILKSKSGAVQRPLDGDGKPPATPAKGQTTKPS